MLLLASELNCLTDLNFMMEFMLHKHFSFSKEISLQLKENNAKKNAALTELENEIKKGPVIPRMR
jgi:hypothetical protein